MKANSKKEALTDVAVLRKMRELQATGLRSITAGEMARMFTGGAVKVLGAMLRVHRRLKRLPAA